MVRLDRLVEKGEADAKEIFEERLRAARTLAEILGIKSVKVLEGDFGDDGGKEVILRVFSDKEDEEDETTTDLFVLPWGTEEVTKISLMLL